MHPIFECNCGGSGWYTKEQDQDGKVWHVISCDKCGTQVMADLYRECKWRWREKMRDIGSDHYGRTAFDR
jgi:hypothetical protein